MYLKGGENLNFAIPINDAKRLLLAESTKSRHCPTSLSQYKRERLLSRYKRNRLKPQRR